MSGEASHAITQLLHAANHGDSNALNHLWSAIYDEMHRLARAQLAREGPGCTLQTTSLVHEAYLRLVGTEPLEWANRRHFFGAAANAMRRIRVDEARKRKGLKRGGGQKQLPLQEDPFGFDDNPVQLLAVDEALRKLEQVDPCKAEVVMLRYFAGLSVDETAAALRISPREVDNEWRFAKAWLHQELHKGDTTAA